MISVEELSRGHRHQGKRPQRNIGISSLSCWHSFFDRLRKKKKRRKERKEEKEEEEVELKQIKKNVGDQRERFRNT